MRYEKVRGLLGLVSVVSAISVVNPAPARAADPPITIENLRVGIAQQPSAGLFKVGTWTPVWVDLKAGAERFKGTLEVVVPDDDGTSTLVRRPVDVPNDKQMHPFLVYVRPGTRTPTFRARVVDERGYPRGKEVENSDAEPVEPGQVYIATIGNPRGVDEVPGMPGFAAPTTGPTPTLVRVAGVHLGGLTGDALPNEWYGYDGVETVVLDINDAKAMELLRQKGKPLRDWVARGGHLVVAVGQNWQQANDSFLREMLPALPSGTLPLQDLAALENYAGAGRFNGTLTVAKLDLVPGRGGQILAATAAVPPTPLVVRGPFGFGRVTVVPISVDQKPFADWAGKKEFWSKALDLRGRADAAGNVTSIPVGGGAFYQMNANDLASILHLALERFPGVKLVPFGWVAFFVFLYILLIGPGDYLFLKKVLKRMELTWVTFPLIVIGVSLLAYIAAYAVKGTDLRVNKVDTLDIDQTGPKAVMRGASFFTLFSPRNRDYDVTVAPLAIDSGGAGEAQPPPLTGVAPLMSWFGGPEPIMGGSDRLGLSGSTYAYAPAGEAERLEGVRVAIWSTKSFMARWSAPTGPVVDADLRPIGAGRLAGTVTNRLNRTLEDVWVCFGKQVYLFDKIAPGQTVRIETVQNRVLSHLLEERARPFQQGGALYQNDPNPTAALPRGDLLRAAMFRDDMPGREMSAPSNPLRFLDLSAQLAFDRPMLVAGLKGPAAQLKLTDVKDQTRIEQDTVLRVILPLAPPEGQAPASSAEPGPEEPKAGPSPEKGGSR